MDRRRLAIAAEEVPAVPFEIPGASGEFRIQLLNQDAATGVVTSIIHLPPGGRIPAHRHRAGAEMHYVLDGDLVEAGQAHRAGAFLTHAAGEAHGPHESRGGAKVLTVQSWQSRDGAFDFEPVTEAEAPPPDARADARPGAAAGDGPGEMRPVDQRAQSEARQKEAEPEARGYS